MQQLSFNRFRSPTRNEWIAGIGSLLGIAIYLVVLNALDRRAEQYFQDLRESDPATYLIQLRESRGFSAYLPEYAELTGHGAFKPEPPSFLVGRWTMREDMLRLIPGQAPEVCSDPVTFDYGLYLSVESGGVALPVQYRLAGETVEMQSRGDSVFPIRLVSYGAQLDHVEFTPPGRDTPVFAYLCGR